MARIPEKALAWLMFAAFGAAIFMISAVARADSITTTTVPGGPIVLGSGTVMKDSADLSGTTPVGSITFTLHNPANFVIDTETVPVSGNGPYFTPVGYVPTTIGTWDWFASFTGSDAGVVVTITSGAEPVNVVASTPEPSSLLLFGTGLLGLGGIVRRKLFS